jgi:glycosyltransferase involved in cell wall biosynthesis
LDIPDHSIRVLRIAEDYPVGGKPSYGLQPVFYYLSKEQARLGYEVNVIARRHEGQPAFENQDGINVFRVDTPFNITAFRKLKDISICDQSKKIPSVVHVHSTAGIFTVPLKNVIKFPIVSHVHGSTRSRAMPVRLKFGLTSADFSSRRMWYSYFRERLLWRFADRIVSVCSSAKEDLIAHYDIPREKIRVVYNGVDTSLFREVPNPTLPANMEGLQGKRIILYVGHFGLRKGLIFLIRAMREVILEVPDSVLVCVGGVPGWLGSSDYWAFLNRTIEENDLQGRVFLLDRVPNSKLPVFYSSASVFVLASFYEAMPKVILEAMACSRPVIATKLGGPEEVVEDGVTGYLVDYGYPHQIAEAIVKVLQDPKKARMMGIKAREKIERDFTWSAVARRIGEVYEEALHLGGREES